jgi:glutathione peroxidase-family protein
MNHHFIHAQEHNIYAIQQMNIEHHPMIIGKLKGQRIVVVNFLAYTPNDIPFQLFFSLDTLYQKIKHSYQVILLPKKDNSVMLTDSALKHILSDMLHFPFSIFASVSKYNLYDTTKNSLVRWLNNSKDNRHFENEYNHAAYKIYLLNNKGELLSAFYEHPQINTIQLLKNIFIPNNQNDHN